MASEDDKATGDPVLGARLRALRKAAGLSQPALAALLGLRHSQVSRIESGKRSTSPAILARWYRECGYELEAVEVGSPDQANSLALAASSVPEDQLDSVISVIGAWHKLSERTRGRILGLIEGDAN